RVRLRQSALGRGPPSGRAGRLESVLLAPARPLRLPRNGVYAGDAAGEGIGRSGRAVPADRLLAGAADQRSPRARRAVRRLARPEREPAAARERPLPGRRAAGGGALSAAAAAGDTVRLVRAPDDAGAARRLPPPRRLLLPGTGAARARAGRAALRPRPGLGRPSRRRGRSLAPQLHARTLAAAPGHSPRAAAARSAAAPPAADGAAARAGGTTPVSAHDREGESR